MTPLECFGLQSKRSEITFTGFNNFEWRATSSELLEYYPQPRGCILFLDRRINDVGSKQMVLFFR